MNLKPIIGDVLDSGGMKDVIVALHPSLCKGRIYCHTENCGEESHYWWDISQLTDENLQELLEMELELSKDMGVTTRRVKTVYYDEDDYIFRKYLYGAI